MKTMPVENNPATGRAQQVVLFDPRTAAPFVEKSISEETRRVYRRVIREFFAFVDHKNETLVTPQDVIRWRDQLIREGKKGATISLKLSVVRSFFGYLKDYGRVALNPASTRLVPPPPLPEDPAGRALAPREARHLFASPDRSQANGARDYAVLLVMGRLSLREAEVAHLRVSSMSWSHGMTIIKFKVKGGRERKLPLPAEVKDAIHEYLKLDRSRRKIASTDGPDAFLFQPHVNPRTLVYDKPLSTRMIRKIVARYAEFAQVGRVTPHDLRRTAITRALDLGYSIREVQMMSGHKDIRSLMRYDRGRDNLEKNPVRGLHYDDDEPSAASSPAGPTSLSKRDGRIKSRSDVKMAAPSPSIASQTRETPVPVIGQAVYLPPSFHLAAVNSGQAAALCVIDRVDFHNAGYQVRVAEYPEREFDWNFLSARQVQWERTYNSDDETSAQPKH